MKKLLALFLFLPLFAYGQTTGHMQVNVSKAIAMTEGSFLLFGNLSFVSQGSVIISPKEVRTFTGGVSAKDANFSPNVFILKGSPNSQFQLILPQSATLTDGKTTLTATAFTSDLVDNKGILDGSGNYVLKIGATISFSEATTSGQYQGTYELQTIYN